jgi:hypothetical protein
VTIYVSLDDLTRVLEFQDENTSEIFNCCAWGRDSAVPLVAVGGLCANIRIVRCDSECLKLENVGTISFSALTLNLLDSFRSWRTH